MSILGYINQEKYPFLTEYMDMLISYFDGDIDKAIYFTNHLLNDMIESGVVKYRNFYNPG